jgi:ferredoxin
MIRSKSNIKGDNMAFKVEINAEECIGCGACVAACADVYDMEGDKAVVKEAETEKECANEGADGCPVNCIKVTKME